MAKIGVKNFLYGKLTERSDGTISYAAPKKPGRAVSFKVNVTNNSAKLFADDALAESDTSFQGATVNVGIDEDDIEMLAEVLGHQMTGGEMVRNINDIAPYFGFGRILTKMVGGKYRYRADFLKKVQLSEPSQDDQTKGESLSFGTYELDGVVMALENGDWSVAKEFDTWAAAESYLRSCFVRTSPAQPSLIDIMDTSAWTQGTGVLTVDLTGLGGKTIYFGGADESGLVTKMTLTSYDSQDTQLATKDKMITETFGSNSVFVSGSADHVTVTITGTGITPELLAASDADLYVAETIRTE